MKSFYTKKINDWELNIEYIYIPSEPSTHDYPGYGSQVEIQSAYIENEKDGLYIKNGIVRDEVDISDFLYEFCPEAMSELEKEIVESYEDN